MSLVDQTPICADAGQPVVLDFQFTNSGSQGAGAFRLDFTGLTVTAVGDPVASNGRNWTGVHASGSLVGLFGDDTSNPRLANGENVTIQITATVTGGSTVTTAGSVANDFNPNSFSPGQALTNESGDPSIYTDCSIEITAPSPIFAGFPATFSATIVDGNGNVVIAQDPSGPVNIAFAITAGTCSFMDAPLSVPAPAGETGDFSITFLTGSGTGTCTLTGTANYDGGGIATGSVVIDVEGNATTCTGIAGCNASDAAATSQCTTNCGSSGDPAILFVDQQTSPATFCGGSPCLDYYVTGIDSVDGLLEVTLHITGLRRSEIDIYSLNKVTNQIVKLKGCTPSNGAPCIVDVIRLSTFVHDAIIRVDGDPPAGWR